MEFCIIIDIALKLVVDLIAFLFILRTTGCGSLNQNSIIGFGK